MTPILTHERSLPPAITRPTRTIGQAADQMNVIGALLEALNEPGRYRLIERGGEIYIERARDA